MCCMPDVGLKFFFILSTFFVLLSKILYLRRNKDQAKMRKKFHHPLCCYFLHFDVVFNDFFNERMCVLMYGWENIHCIYLNFLRCYFFLLSFFFVIIIKSFNLHKVYEKPLTFTPFNNISL